MGGLGGGGGSSGGGVTTVPTWNKQQKQIFEMLTPQVLQGISRGVSPFAPTIDAGALAQWTPPIDWGQLASIANYADWEKLGLTDLSAGGLATLLRGIDPAYAMKEYTDVIGPKVYEAVAPQVMESLAGGMSSDLLHGTPALNAFAQALAPYGPQWVGQRMGMGQQAVQQAYGRESELYQRSQAAYALKQAQWETAYQRAREEFLRTQPENSVWFDRAMQLLGVTTQAGYATQPTTSPLMQILSGLAPGFGAGIGDWFSSTFGGPDLSGVGAAGGFAAKGGFDWSGLLPTILPFIF